MRELITNVYDYLLSKKYWTVHSTSVVENTTTNKNCVVHVRDVISDAIFEYFNIKVSKQALVMKQTNTPPLLDKALNFHSSKNIGGTSEDEQQTGGFGEGLSMALSQICKMGFSVFMNMTRGMGESSKQWVPRYAEDIDGDLSNPFEIAEHSGPVPQNESECNTLTIMIQKPSNQPLMSCIDLFSPTNYAQFYRCTREKTTKFMGDGIVLSLHDNGDFKAATYVFVNGFTFSGPYEFGLMRHIEVKVAHRNMSRDRDSFHPEYNLLFDIQNKIAKLVNQDDAFAKAVMDLIVATVHTWDVIPSEIKNFRKSTKVRLLGEADLIPVKDCDFEKFAQVLPLLKQRPMRMHPKLVDFFDLDKDLLSRVEDLLMSTPEKIVWQPDSLVTWLADLNAFMENLSKYTSLRLTFHEFPAEAATHKKLLRDHPLYGSRFVLNANILDIPFCRKHFPEVNDELDSEVVCRTIAFVISDVLLKRSRESGHLTIKSFVQVLKWLEDPINVKLSDESLASEPVISKPKNDFDWMGVSDSKASSKPSFEIGSKIGSEIASTSSSSTTASKASSTTGPTEKASPKASLTTASKEPASSEAWSKASSTTTNKDSVSTEASPTTAYKDPVSSETSSKASHTTFPKDPGSSEASPKTFSTTSPKDPASTESSPKAWFTTANKESVSSGASSKASPTTSSKDPVSSEASPKTLPKTSPTEPVSSEASPKASSTTTSTESVSSEASSTTCYKKSVPSETGGFKSFASSVSTFESNMTPPSRCFESSFVSLDNMISHQKPVD
jgi:hypothetical protein